MFTWNEDMIRFLQDASEQSDYHRLLAKYLRSEEHTSELQSRI